MSKGIVLILSFSQVHKDPRILRQIKWVRELGHSRVVVIGSGRLPAGADEFYPVQVKRTLARYFGYFIRVPRRRFDYFFGKALKAIEADLPTPELLIVNEVEFLGWSLLNREDIATTPTYLDLHEDHIHDAHSNMAEAFAFKKFWLWQTANLISFVKSRRAGLFITSVETEIARTYADAFEREVSVIMNAPDYVELTPSSTQVQNIKLVHHGIGTRNRGIETSIVALKELPSNYSLTLILIQNWAYRLKLEVIARLHGVRSRVTIRGGAPLSELPRVLNQFDLGLVLQSDATVNHLNSLPNKLFESIQGRLAIVCGPNPAIKAIVETHALGVASKSWDVVDVRSAILSLSAEGIEKHKNNSSDAARILSSSESQRVFNQGLRGIL